MSERTELLSESEALFYCQEMFRHANGYYEFAEAAEKDLPKMTKYSIGGVTPAGINYSLACEIFLKSLILYKSRDFDEIKKRSKKHGLRELFEKLPKEWQDSVREYMEQRRLWRNMWGFENLEINSNVFVDWRYCYEKFWRKHATMQFDTRFLKVFAEVLKESCAGLFYKQK